MRHNENVGVSRTLLFKCNELFVTIGLSKSKYGSVEPPNTSQVAELILCDTLAPFGVFFCAIISV